MHMTVFGAGYSGKAIADLYRQAGHAVSGTTRSVEKFGSLQALGIEPLQFDGKRYILHGLLGYEYLLEQGVDESIAQFCRNHTGVGLTREDVVRQELPLPPADYVPMNLEQEVVMYADKFHSKSVPPKFLQVEAYTARAERFGGENKQRWLDLVAKYGVPDIPALAEKYGMRMI